MKKSAVLVLMALFTNGVAQAGNCDEATTQTAMNTCSAEAYQRADRVLNTAYNSLMAKLSTDQRAILKKAEVAWIALRDADCAFVSSGAEGGSVYSMIRNQCMIDKTHERHAFLTSLMQCKEGDVSCPTPLQH